MSVQGSETPGVPEEVARAALRALWSLADVDGAVDSHEQALLDAAAKALGVSAPTAGIEPEALAAAVVDPIHRLRVVQAMELMALLDGEVVEEEVLTVERFAAVLQVRDPRLGNLQQLRSRHLRLLQLDLMRRSPMAKMAWEVLDSEGLPGVFRFATSPYRRSEDPGLAGRFRALGELPVGTFGREYHDHMRARGFSFPGEPKGFPEELVRHDLCHVLSGYDTDVAGECQNAAWIAGFLKDDPFSYLFMVAVHTHLDVEVFPDDPSQASMAFDPALVVPALQRGMAVRRDLYGLDWDYWADFPRPLAAVRDGLGIVDVPPSA